MSIVHGGNLEKLAAEAHCAPDEILDFSVNLNPCGQPEGLFQVWFRAFDHAAPYPEPYDQISLVSGNWAMYLCSIGAHGQTPLSFAPFSSGLPTE